MTDNMADSEKDLGKERFAINHAAAKGNPPDGYLDGILDSYADPKYRRSKQRRAALPTSGVQLKSSGGVHLTGTFGAPEAPTDADMARHIEEIVTSNTVIKNGTKEITEKLPLLKRRDSSKPTASSGETK